MARYAEIADIARLGLAAEAISEESDEKKNAALDRASRDADGLIGNAYKLPLVSWDDDLRGWVIDIAVYYILGNRGFNPMGMDQDVVKRRDDAFEALKSVAAGRARLLNAVDSTPDQYDGGAYVVTRARRGWGG